MARGDMMAIRRYYLFGYYDSRSKRQHYYGENRVYYISTYANYLNQRSIRADQIELRDKVTEE